jgi:uncharacterized LabA/DUF88 family protein
MYFVDGENLTIRVGALLKSRERSLKTAAIYRENVLIWVNSLAPSISGVIRKHYYTSAPSNGVTIPEFEDLLISAGIEAPRVFPKNKAKGSKRVDIALATDMLSHSMRGHVDIAILVAGDEDYVPLVKAVQAQGVQVHVWFVSDGISPDLRRAADRFVDITEYFLEPKSAS